MLFAAVTFVGTIEVTVVVGIDAVVVSTDGLSVTFCCGVTNVIAVVVMLCASVLMFDSFEMSILTNAFVVDNKIAPTTSDSN